VIAWHLFGAFILAVTALMLFPGPNVALIVSNSVTRGPRYGLLTVAGTASAMVIQLAITALGLSAALGIAGHWFGALRSIGALYLIFLGLQSCLAPTPGIAAAPQKSGASIFRRGLIVSLTNPKTLFFYAAFFPQFLTPGPHQITQIAVLAATFVAIAVIIDSCWALGAHWARSKILGRQIWANRISGGVLIGAGLGLAFARAK
jgi:threonine/homoserine/homoserine lactone efflux protein